MLTSKVPFIHIIHKKTNEVLGILSVYINITNLKRTQEELAESKTREAHFKAISSVGGMIAHELRTPLASIELNAQTMQECFPILVKAYHELSKIGYIEKIRKAQLYGLEKIPDNIEQAARYASNTIRTILAGFHYSTSEIQPLSEINVNTVVQQALLNYPLSQEERTLITFQSTEECKVMASAEILIHVLHNLLKNSLYAIRSANKGVITISVEKLKDGAIQLLFKDTAKGIPQEIQTHIFEPFYTTKDSETSIGLGLYFCKMALEKIGASIVCDSKLGEYTLFIIKFKGLSS